MHEESPEGGRFKKEVFINDQSYLLLIRDEGGVPEAQVHMQEKHFVSHICFAMYLSKLVNQHGLIYIDTIKNQSN